MQTPKELIRLLGLSTKERHVLEALKLGFDTPLAIERETKVSRPAIYAALKRFRERGLVKSHIVSGRKHWTVAPISNIESALYDTKKFLFDISEGVEEVRGVDDAMVIVHRGQDAARKVIRYIMVEHKHERFYAIQGDGVVPGWDKVFGEEGVNDLNRNLKKNDLISEMVMPEGLFERQVKNLGKEWAIDFEGRAAITNYVDEEYFEHAGQIWVFKNSVYLIAMHEEIIIEIRNSETQKLILSMFQFMQDHSRKIDVNVLLRELIAKEGGRA